MPFLLTVGERPQWIRLDDADLEWASRCSWHVVPAGYVRRWDSSQNRATMLHREILGLEPGDTRQADHINGNGFDNRRCNLRLVTPSQNQQNQGKRPGTTSRYRNVSLTHRGKWEVRVKAFGISHFIGTFESEDAAGLAAAQARASFQPFAVENRCAA